MIGVFSVKSYRVFYVGIMNVESISTAAREEPLFSKLFLLYHMRTVFAKYRCIVQVVCVKYQIIHTWT